VQSKQQPQVQNNKDVKNEMHNISTTITHTFNKEN
jgi:hypothetical protein